jgi:hypothetical protein
VFAGVAFLLGIAVYLAQRTRTTEPEPVPPYIAPSRNNRVRDGSDHPKRLGPTIVGAFDAWPDGETRAGN